MPRLLIATNTIPRHSERRPRLYGVITLFAKESGAGQAPASQSSYRQMLTPSTPPVLPPRSAQHDSLSASSATCGKPKQAVVILSGDHDRTGESRSSRRIWGGADSRPRRAATARCSRPPPPQSFRPARPSMTVEAPAASTCGKPKQAVVILSGQHDRSGSQRMPRRIWGGADSRARRAATARCSRPPPRPPSAPLGSA